MVWKRLPSRMPCIARRENDASPYRVAYLSVLLVDASPLPIFQLAKPQFQIKVRSLDDAAKVDPEK